MSNAASRYARINDNALKYIAVLLLLAVIGTAAPLPALALEENAPPLESEPPFELACPSAILIEASTCRAIFEYNADERRPVASVTKLMTILLALEALKEGRCTLTETIVASARAEGMGGSQALLDSGGMYEYGELLKSVIVGSANDSSVALAEHLYGSEEGFVIQMNRRAQELGLDDTHYVNCTGLPAQGHYTTARDIAVLSTQVMQHSVYFDYSTIWLDEITHNEGRVTQLTNTNRMIRLYDGCDGIKTGSTNEAGFCMSASAKRGDIRLIAVVLGANTSKERFAMASKMLDHGFANYTIWSGAHAGDIVEADHPVESGDPACVDIVLGEDARLLVSKTDASRITLKRTLPEALHAPLPEGAEVGMVHVMLDENILCELPAVTAQELTANGFGESLERIMRQWLYK